MGNNDVCIEDNHRDLYELMGTTEYMKENLQKLVSINQSNHFQDSLVKDHPMEETSIVQPIKDPKGKQLE